LYADRYYDEERCVGCSFDPKEAAFSDAIGRFWTAFASSGDPSSAALAWQPFTASSRQNIFLRPDAITMERDLGRPDACKLWDAVDKAYGGH
jgi:carboxylesterase type B